MGLGSKDVVPGEGLETFPQPPGVKPQGTTASADHIPTHSWLRLGNATVFA